jgi:MFS family permease
MFGMFFLGALYLQRVLNYSSIGVGLAFLPVALGIAALSLRFAPQLITRFGARATLLPGLVLIFGGLALFARSPIHASYAVDVLPPMVLLGVGAGLSFPALMTLAMSDASPSDSGLASGLVNTTQQVGGALGLAVLATLSTTHTHSLLAGGAATASALTSGYHLAFTVGAALVLASIVLVVAVLRPQVGLAGVEEAADGGVAPEFAYVAEESA